MMSTCMEGGMYYVDMVEIVFNKDTKNIQVQKRGLFVSCTKLTQENAMTLKSSKFQVQFEYDLKGRRFEFDFKVQLF